MYTYFVIATRKDIYVASVLPCKEILFVDLQECMNIFSVFHLGICRFRLNLWPFHIHVLPVVTSSYFYVYMKCTVNEF